MRDRGDLGQRAALDAAVRARHVGEGRLVEPLARQDPPFDDDLGVSWDLEVDRSRPDELERRAEQPARERVLVDPRGRLVAGREREQWMHARHDRDLEREAPRLLTAEDVRDVRDRRERGDEMRGVALHEAVDADVALARVGIAADRDAERHVGRGVALVMGHEGQSVEGRHRHPRARSRARARTARSGARPAAPAARRVPRSSPSARGRQDARCARASRTGCP